MKFESFPIIMFYRLMLKGDHVARRWLKRYCPTSNWEDMKTKWEVKTRDEKGDPLFEKQRQLTILVVQQKKHIAILQWAEHTERDFVGLLIEAGISLPRDKDAAKERLQKEINKLGKRIDKTSREIKALTDRSEEEIGELEFDLQGVYNGIASLDLAGFHIEDYEKLTIGKYLAMTKLAKEKTSKAPTHG